MKTIMNSVTDGALEIRPPEVVESDVVDVLVEVSDIVGPCRGRNEPQESRRR